MWNGFYDLSEIKDIETLKQLFKTCLSLSVKAFVDIKKADSWARTPCDFVTPDEFIDKYLTLKTHNVVINRYIHSGEASWAENHGEVGSSTMSADENLYLFIFMDMADLLIVVKKYNLKKIEL